MRKERQKDKAEKRAQRKLLGDGTAAGESEDGVILSTDDGDAQPGVDVTAPSPGDLESRARSSTVPPA
jgi:hypothetical protein